LSDANLDYAEEDWKEYMTISGNYVKINLGNTIKYSRSEFPETLSFHLEGIFYDIVRHFLSKDNLITVDETNPATIEDLMAFIGTSERQTKRLISKLINVGLIIKDKDKLYVNKEYVSFVSNDKYVLVNTLDGEFDEKDNKKDSQCKTK
jgi:hypothetical protein